MKELVIDISHWNGDINLQDWKNKRGLWGVIIKCGGNEKKLGRYKDPQFENNYKKAVAAGLHIGFYYYTVTQDIATANADANHMVSIIGNKAYDLPWYMDVEDAVQFGLSKRKLTDTIKSFCDTLVYKGKYAGLYTGGIAFNNNMYPSELSNYANWIAWWRDKWPSECGDIGMWQQGGMDLWTGKISYDINVISAGVEKGWADLDWCIIDYPSRINNGQTKFTTEQPAEEIQNGSKKEVTSNLGRATDVINAAYGELGYYAPNDPERGSKYGRWMASLFNEDWLAGPSTSIWWCCMFVSWCLDKGGVKMDGFPTYNTDLALSKGAKKYAVDKKKVRYGDIIIFNWDWNATTDHIGFATGEFDGTGFTTIEGNIGNAVVEKYRQMGNVAYVLRPPYEAYGVAGQNVPSVDTTPKNNRDGGKLEVDGIGGWNTIIDWQNQLGINEDGKIEGQYNSNKQYHSGMCNVSYDGTGSKLVLAIQAKVGTDIDGQWGPGTSKAIQQWLEDNCYSVGFAGVDGYFGTESVKALQESLNDGKWK